MTSGFRPNAFFSFTQRDVYSADQAALSLGVSANYLSASVRGELQTSTQRSESAVIVSFTQTYYTISVPSPASPSSIFVPEVRVEDLAPYADPSDNPLGFIQSVTYGRRAMLIVSSSERRERLYAAVNAAASFAVGSGSASLTQEQQSVFQQGEVRLVMLGGNADDVQVIKASNKVDALRAALATPTTPDTLARGVPITFRVDYLSDNSPMRLTSATEYDVIDRAPRARLQNISISFHTANDDKDDDTRVFASIIGPENQTLARGSFTTRQEWQNNSDHTFGLSGSVRADLVGQSVLRVWIEPNGNDTWRFDVKLDGDGYHWERGGHTLKEDNKAEQTALDSMTDSCTY